MPRYAPTPERQREIKALLHDVQRWIESNRQAGATVAKVEARMGVARGTLARWLRGATWPTRKNIAELRSMTLTGSKPTPRERGVQRKTRAKLEAASQAEAEAMERIGSAIERREAENSDAQYDGD